MRMKLDAAGRAFIFNEEGLRTRAYKCPAGVWTIGIGSTYYSDGSKVAEGDVITKEKCYQLFDSVVKSFENMVSLHVKQPLNKNQFNALVSFAFNVGIGAFASSTLVKKINAQLPEAIIRAEFAKWNKADGKVNKTLTSRRKREADLYFKK